MDRFIARSTICYLLSAERKHKHKKNALESLLRSPHPQVGLPKLWFVWLFFVFLCSLFFFLGTSTPPLPKPNAKQVIQNVCMLILSGVGERWWANNEAGGRRFNPNLSKSNLIHLASKASCVYAGIPWGCAIFLLGMRPLGMYNSLCGEWSLSFK